MRKLAMSVLLASAVACGFGSAANAQGFGIGFGAFGPGMSPGFGYGPSVGLGVGPSIGYSRIGVGSYYYGAGPSFRAGYSPSYRAGYGMYGGLSSNPYRYGYASPSYAMRRPSYSVGSRRRCR